MMILTNNNESLRYTYQQHKVIVVLCYATINDDARVEFMHFLNNNIRSDPSN